MVLCTAACVIDPVITEGDTPQAAALNNTETTGPSGASEAAAAEYSKTTAPPVQTEQAGTLATRYPGVILAGARTHRVVWGDTLSRIAKKYYGPAKGYYFPLIMLASGDRIVDPDRIIPGMYVSIPDLQKNLGDPKAKKQLKTLFLEVAGVYEKKGKPIIQHKLLQIAQSL
jgi:nucleoid-associated protein YgaU